MRERVAILITIGYQVRSRSPGLRHRQAAARRATAVAAVPRRRAFGDAVVTTPDGELRMWIQEPLDERSEAFYRDRFAPTLQELLELGAQRVLVTHGAPVVEGGAEALRRAIANPPWYHRG